MWARPWPVHCFGTSVADLLAQGLASLHRARDMSSLGCIALRRVPIHPMPPHVESVVKSLPSVLESDWIACLPVPHVPGLYTHPPILHDSSETPRVPARPETMPMIGCLEEALGAILHAITLPPLGAISGDVLCIGPPPSALSVEQSWKASLGIRLEEGAP
eukprot:4641619-Pyramimonas_sp.AAC.3